MKILQKTCFVVLLTTFASVYAGSCFEEPYDVDDCRVKAEQGDSDAQYNLAVMYKNGQGVLQDYKESVKWFKLVAEQGDSGAQYNLAAMYKNGQGVLQDYKESVKWLKLAVEQGDSRAQFALGLSYYVGKGVPQDYVMSHIHLNIAAVSGGEDAIEARGLVEKKMTPSQLEEAQDLAREWMRKHQ